MTAPASFICALCGKDSSKAEICSWHTPSYWPNTRKLICKPEKAECEPVYARAPHDAMPITEQGIALKHMPYPEIDQEVYACCLVPIRGNHPHSEGCWTHSRHVQTRPTSRAPLDITRRPNAIPDTWEMSPYTNQEAWKEIKEALDSDDVVKALQLEYVFNSTFGDTFNPGVTQTGKYKVWDTPPTYSSIVINPGASGKEGVKVRAEACLNIPEEVKKAIEALAKGMQLNKQDEGIHNALQRLGKEEQVEDVWESIVHVKVPIDLNIRQATELAYELGLTANSPVTIAGKIKDVPLQDLVKSLSEEIDEATWPEVIEEGELKNYSRARKEHVKDIISRVAKSNNLDELAQVMFLARAHKMINSDPWKSYLESWKLGKETTLTQFIDNLRDDPSVRKTLENETFVALEKNIFPYECCLVFDLALCMVEAYYVRKAIPEILALDFDGDTPVCIVQKYAVIDITWREMIRQMQAPLMVQAPEKLVDEFMARYNRIKYISETNPPWKVENLHMISEEYERHSMLHYDNLASIVKPFIVAEKKIEEKKTEETQKIRQEEDKHHQELLVHARYKLLYLWANWFENIPEGIEQKFLKGEKNNFATQAKDDAMKVLTVKMKGLNIYKIKPGKLVEERSTFWGDRITKLGTTAGSWIINDLDSLNRSFEAFSELLYIDDKIIADIDNVYEREKKEAEKPAVELKEAQNMLLKTLRDALEYALELVNPKTPTKETDETKESILKSNSYRTLISEDKNALPKYVLGRRPSTAESPDSVEIYLAVSIITSVAQQFSGISKNKMQPVKAFLQPLYEKDAWDINKIEDVTEAIENLQKMMAIRKELYDLVSKNLAFSEAEKDVDDIDKQFLSRNFSQYTLKAWKDHIKRTLIDIKKYPHSSSVYIQELREFAGSFNDYIIFDRYKTEAKGNLEIEAFNTMVYEVYSLFGDVGGLDFKSTVPKSTDFIDPDAWGNVNAGFIQDIHATEPVKRKIQEFIKTNVAPEIIKVLKHHKTWVATEESVRHIITVAKGICRDMVYTEPPTP
jgi:hypothetical protein